VIFQVTQDQGMHQFDRAIVNWLSVKQLIEYTPLQTMFFDKFFPLGCIIKFKPGIGLFLVLVIGAWKELRLFDFFKVVFAQCTRRAKVDAKRGKVDAKRGKVDAKRGKVDAKGGKVDARVAAKTSNLA
jgi:hypothetical protein